MIATTVKVVRVTGDANASLVGVKHIHAIVGITSTLTSAASVKLHDALTVTGNPVMEAHASTADATNYEQTFGLVLPYPLKVTTGLSIDVTNVSAAYVYWS
jgi:hypothetical protein